MTKVSESAERSRASLELLYTISRELTSHLDLSQLLRRVLVLTLENVGAASGSILVLDEDGEPAEGAYAYEGDLHNHTADQLEDTLKKGLAGWVVRNREAALVPSTKDDSRWLQRAREEGEADSRSAISVPLMARDRVVGVLTMVHPTAGQLTEADLELLSAIGERAGIAVENARLYTAEQERRRLAMTMQDIARTISSALDPAQVFPQVLEQLDRIVQHDSASILLLEDEMLRVVAATGFRDNQAMVGRMIPVLDGGIITRVLSERKCQRVTQVDPASNWVQSVDDREAERIRSWIGAPLVVRDRAVGLLSIDSHEAGSFGEKAEEVVTAYSAQVATAVANAQLFAQTQAARQLYAGLFEDSIDPILISDLSGRISDVNHSAEVFMGYGRDELWADSVLSHHVPDEQEVPAEVFNLARGQTVSYQGRATHKEGYPLPVEVYVKRIDIEGQPFLQWILRDISERLELEELRSDLTSMIFHDLRSPLGNVISSLEVLKSSLPAEDETLQAVLAIAQRSGRRLSRLIDSLLDLERLESGKAVLNREPASIDDLIDEAVEEVRPIAEAKGHRLVIDVERDLAELSLDRDMVQRVLINLLDNAIKYTRSDGLITVSASKGKQDIVVSVQDTGPGIPEGEQEHIFEKFTRVVHEPRPKGLGLGLAFCQLAVEVHGGSIWLQSAPGEGSKFSFSLPIG